MTCRTVHPGPGVWYNATHAPPARYSHGAVRLLTGLDPERIARNVAQVRDEIADACARAGRSTGDVELLAAVKYVDVAGVEALRDAGITLAGENRAQELERKVVVPGLTWDFIGQLQSRKVKTILPLVRLIHSVASASVVRELGRHAPAETQVLVEVNVSGEDAKGGVAPAELAAFIASCREEGGVEVAGLMTMPPPAADPQDSRRWFAALAQLAADHGLAQLSMGTTQDFVVAVEEGATIIRVGARLIA